MDEREGIQVFDTEDLSSGFHVVSRDAETSWGDKFVIRKAGVSFYRERSSYDFETCFTKAEWARVNRFDMNTGRYLSEEEWNVLHPTTS
jgi:hypothetical protein